MKSSAQLCGFIFIWIMAACSASNSGRNREVSGPYPSDLYLLVTDGNGKVTEWGPFGSEDGRYYDLRPRIPADGIYEFKIVTEDQSLSLGYQRISFDPNDAVVALEGKRDASAFRIPLRGPQSYRFLLDTQNVSKPFLSINPSQTLNSVEYKLMLKATRFTNGFADVEILRNEIEQMVKDTLGENAVTSVKGQPEVEADRKTVYFYDTARSCMFRRVGLIVRERKSYVDKSREFTLKVRGKDESEISQAFVTTKYNTTDSKLEEEVSFAGDKDIYAIKKSYSYSVDQIVPETQEIFTISDFYELYPEYYQNKDTSKLNPKDVLISTMRDGVLEKIYVITSANLAGESEASMVRKIELTLWYKDDTSTEPIIAELSFKMKESSGNFSKETRSRSDAIFKEMNSMEYWVAPDGITKTNFAYGFDPSFCL